LNDFIEFNTLVLLLNGIDGLFDRPIFRIDPEVDDFTDPSGYPAGGTDEFQMDPEIDRIVDQGIQTLVSQLRPRHHDHHPEWNSGCAFRVDGAH
jgi:hypothetical protein